jgi:hypothetical protein
MNGNASNEGRITWTEVATRPDVVRRSLRVAAVVGTMLVLINHGDRLIASQLTSLDLVKIAMTYCVPYCVATYGAVGALLNK